MDNCCLGGKVSLMVKWVFPNKTTFRFTMFTFSKRYVSREKRLNTEISNNQLCSSEFKGKNHCVFRVFIWLLNQNVRAKCWQKETIFKWVGRRGDFMQREGVDERLFLNKLVSAYICYWVVMDILTRVVGRTMRFNLSQLKQPAD